MATSPVVLPPQTRREPALIRAGDTVIWNREFGCYPASEFTLTYVFVSISAQYTVQAGASLEVMDAYLVQVPGATTAAWVPGHYRWEAYIKDGNGNRITVDQGESRVLPNLETATSGIDDRDPDEKMLEAIKAMLAGKLSAGDAQRYTIHGRELQRYTFAELEQLRRQYALRVRTNKVRRGELASSRTVKAAFFG